MITRGDTQVALDVVLGGKHPPVAEDPAAVVLDMLCEAMNSLSRGESADELVCHRLARAVGAELGLTISIEPDREPYVVCGYQPGPASGQAGLARRLVDERPAAGEHRFRYLIMEQVGHVAVLSIQPTEVTSTDPAWGRVLAYVRSQPFDPGQRQVLDRASSALLALWPHAARAVRAQRAQQWVQSRFVENNMTTRELQVLELLAEGLLATSIASRLQLSPRTVHKHLGNIYRKLGVHDRLVAVSLARLQGLVTTYPSSPASPGS
ncbi:MAG: helix-turn-helix transcriptional regulator [Micropruina sp.]|nr:helix-turn-helix transcriptional regulator [Micropruina sp.]